jgi:hypothetical protein
LGSSVAAYNFSSGPKDGREYEIIYGSAASEEIGIQAFLARGDKNVSLT